MPDTLPFSGMPDGLKEKFNRLVESSNTLQKSRGDQFITVNPSKSGLLVSLNLEQVIARIPKSINSSETVVVKLTSVAAGGKYHCRILTGTSTAIVTGNETMPEGMIVPSSDNGLALNLDEDTLPTNTILVPSYAIGKFLGTVAGLQIVGLISVLGVRSGAVSLTPTGDETENTNTWNRLIITSGVNYGGIPVTIQQETGLYFDDETDPTNKKLLGFSRNLSYDAAGRLVGVSSETVTTLLDHVGGTLDTQQNSVSKVKPTNILNFVSGATVTAGATGEAQINCGPKVELAGSSIVNPATILNFNGGADVQAGGAGESVITINLSNATSHLNDVDIGSSSDYAAGAYGLAYSPSGGFWQKAPAGELTFSAVTWNPVGGSSGTGGLYARTVTLNGLFTQSVGDLRLILDTASCDQSSTPDFGF